MELSVVNRRVSLKILQQCGPVEAEVLVRVFPPLHLGEMWVYYK